MTGLRPIWFILGNTLVQTYIISGRLSPQSQELYNDEYGLTYQEYINSTQTSTLCLLALRE